MIPTIVPFELQGAHKDPTLEYRILGCFGTWKNSCAEIREFFTGVRMRKRFTSVVSKMVEIGAG